MWDYMEHLPSPCEALGSNPSTHSNKNMKLRLSKKKHSEFVFVSLFLMFWALIVSTQICLRKGIFWETFYVFSKKSKNWELK
jgi:hypothetical protein